MSDQIDTQRRGILGTALLGLAAAPLAATMASAQTTGAPSAAPVARPSRASFGPLKKVNAGDLSVAYVDEGPSDGPPVLLLHGWPYDIHAYVDVAPILTAVGYRVLIPYLRGYGGTRFRSEATPRNGQQAALAVDAIAFLDALGIEKAVLGGFDWGARTVNIMAALWPERCKGMVSVSGYLIGSQQANLAPLLPKAELQWWYQYFFATERGVLGYRKYTREFAKLIWELASPQWRFGDEVFDRSATAFDNPDHVAITIDNYRWRLSLAPGERRFDAIEAKLATFPTIAVPTITMEGDANGAPHPDPANYARKFTVKYEFRLIKGGIGHNLPQEAPEAFAAAILDVDKF